MVSLCICYVSDTAGREQGSLNWDAVSIGDWYPERSIFQILIALNSGEFTTSIGVSIRLNNIVIGPRSGLVCLQYYQQYSAESYFPTVVFITGLVRTVSCGGWVFITSSDDHDAHDVLMLTYIVCNVPWMIGGISCTPSVHTKSLRRRFVH